MCVSQELSYLRFIENPNQDRRSNEHQDTDCHRSDDAFREQRFRPNLPWRRRRRRAYVDLNAVETSQALANATGRTTTVIYDRGTLVGRAFIGEQVNDQLDLQLGYFTTGTAKAKYSNSLGTASESFQASGVDLSAKVRLFDLSTIVKGPETPFYFRGGLHYSKLSGDSALSIGSYSASGSGSQWGVGFLMGLGYQQKLGSDMNWNFEYRYMNRLGGERVADAHLIMLGICKNL